MKLLQGCALVLGILAAGCTAAELPSPQPTTVASAAATTADPDSFAPLPSDYDGPDIGAGPEPPLDKEFGGEPYFAPGWSCSTGGPWVLDKGQVLWFCLDASYAVAEVVESPVLTAKVAAAKAAGPMTYSTCTAMFPGFVGSYGVAPCTLPDQPITVVVEP